MRTLRWLLPALALAALVWVPSASAIVAGSQVPITSHPHQARVVMDAPSGNYSCGAVIYDATHIVTAAHCMYIDDTLLAPGKVSVGYASANVDTLTAAAVAEVTIPSAYLTDGSYDVAMLQLAAPLTGFGGPSVDAIPLASAATLATGTGAESNAFATGWGALTEGGSTTNDLRGVPLPLRADGICSAFYGPDYVDARGVCAGGKGALQANNRDTCQGDSGGPLALDSGTGAELVGLTSSGLGCGRRLTPAIYTETSDPEIEAVITGTAPASNTLRGSEWPQAASSGAPVATTPPSQAPAPPPPPATIATRDTTLPTARLSKLSCTKRRRCSFRVRASDSGGRVAKLAATLSRKVSSCSRRGEFKVCTVSTRKRKLSMKRVTGGFAASATLVPSKYTLTLVATDSAGNRSRAATRQFRVRR